MANSPSIEIEQINQEIEQLISQLISFKARIAELREKVAGLETPKDEKAKDMEMHIAHILNRREKFLQKKIENAQKKR